MHVRQMDVPDVTNGSFLSTYVAAGTVADTRISVTASDRR